MAHITIGTPSTTRTHSIGVYMPSGKPAVRKTAYNYIETQTQQCNGTSHNMLVAGYWNAVFAARSAAKYVAPSLVCSSGCVFWIAVYVWYSHCSLVVGMVHMVMPAGE